MNNLEEAAIRLF